MSEKKENKKIYVSVYRSTHARASSMAFLLGITLTELAERALSEYLDKLEANDQIATAMEEIRAAEEERRLAEEKRQAAVAKLEKLRQEIVV